MKKKCGPVFKHNCSHCVYMAHFNKSDLYFCKMESNVATLKARYGNNRPNVVSCPSYSKDCDIFKELAEAQRVAEINGYINAGTSH